MGFAIRDQTEKTLSEINVTPLVDVMLVLLIVFMITAPMLTTSVEVDLEQATVAPTADSKEHLVLSITAGQEIWVADKPTNLAILDQRVLAEMQRTGVHDVAIRCDKAVPFGFVLQVIDKLQAASIKGVGLVMDPPAPPGEEPGTPR